MSALTAKFVESVKATTGRRREYADDAIAGLSLRVTESGAKSWALRYRTAAGQQRRLTLGAYPALGLKDARDEAIRQLGAVTTGRDVALEKQVERRKARFRRGLVPQSVQELWAAYDRDVMPGKAAKTAAYQRWLWARHIQPRLGTFELKSLDRGSIRAALKDIGATAPTTANRALALLRHMLNHAVEEEYLHATPLTRVAELYSEASRERVLNDDELRELWTALQAAPKREDVPVSGRMAAAIQLILVTAARPGDVVGMHAREIDRVARSWTVPAERFKGKRPHTVPLSPLAWDLLRSCWGDDPSKWSGFAFPNARSETRHMERKSLTRAMSRVLKGTGISRATPHDLRRTAATYLASERIGAPPHIVSAVLGHAQDGPSITGVYLRHKYDNEKRTALEAWAKLLRAIVAEKTIRKPRHR